MSKSNIMIDIETASTKNNALILSLAAIAFNSSEGIHTIKAEDFFYQKINLDDPGMEFFDRDLKTLDWWNLQSKEALFEAFRSTDNRFPLIKVLKAFIEFVNKYPDSNLWSQGPDFDFVIIKESMKFCNLNWSWPFWKTRDSRTIISFSGIQKEELCLGLEKLPFHDHHPLRDCLKQINGVQLAHKKLNSK